MGSQYKRIFVGLSGGVDSAVSAALLKKAGHDVTGVFIKVWQPDWIECTWHEDRRDAMRVAAHLDIPFITLDLEKEYKTEVIDYMIREYEKGLTPNPDVMCNKTVKFGAFYDWAMSRGADFVATGHYARIVRHSRPGRSSDASYSLFAGKDRNKDQSYFLWTLKQEQLSHILFPVGDLEKNEVRRLAKKFKLPNAEKRDSQGLCFIGKVDIKEFLSHYIKSEKGNVLNEAGEIIGSHAGALFLTIGERHGFTIDKKTSNDRPLYVVDKDIEQNTITVSSLDRKDVSGTNIVHIDKVNWINGNAPENIIGISGKLSARIRYRQPLQGIKIKSIGLTETAVEFDDNQATIAPGQSLVIYDGEECLGGGVIV